MNYSSNSRDIFETLLSALQSREEARYTELLLCVGFREMLTFTSMGIKPPVLKSLYILLTHLTVNPQWTARRGLDLDEFELEIDQGGMTVKFGVIRTLSDILFKELSERFEWFFSSLGDATTSMDVGQGGLLLERGIDAEILLLLLRCCLVILILLVVQQNLLLERGKVLLVILRKLSSFHLARREKTKNKRFEKSVRQACRHANNECTTSFMEDIVASLHFLEPSDSLLSFLSAIVEVFVDELEVHGQLREYFKLIDSAFSLGENLFMPRFSQGAIGVLVETVSCHFALSFSDEKSVEDSVNRLFWVQGEDLKHSLRAPEVSLTAATSLLLNPVVLSAPKYMLAHVVSLVSEACNNMTNLQISKSNHRLINCFLSVFQKSVILYRKYMSTLQIEGLSGSARASFAKANINGRTSQPSFESCMSPERRRKINDLMRMLDDSSHSQLQNIIVGTKSEMVNSTIRYVKKSRNVLDFSCQDEVLSILSNLILRVSGGINGTVIHAIEDGSLQDIYLLSSLLKLIGTSLLSALFCLRHNSNSGSLRTLKDLSSRKEYDFIASMVSCFKEFSIHAPIQQQLSDMMETFSLRHKDSKMMFIHFSGILSLTFATGLDCLAKGCLLIIKAVVNLFIFEEGNLDALQSLVDCAAECLSSGSPLLKVHESVGDQNSSLVVASKFQKIRTLYSSVTDSRAISYMAMEDGHSQASASALALDGTEGILAMEEETEETTNGEIFLKCMLQNQNISDFDDLAGFIECKQGKNYSTWLKKRQRYRNWKCEKMAVLRWKKKKKTWKLIKGKNT